jgi:hypothetical protein
MKPRRVLFALSADFGEYVTASLFSRGSGFAAQFALPPQLARYAPAGQANVSVYEGMDDLAALAARLRPDVAVLASGYLFPVNRLATPEALRDLLARLGQAGCAVATTDPWLRVWSLRPGSRFAIHSVRKGGVDAELSDRMQALQHHLEQLFRDVPHLYAAPMPTTTGTSLPFFNPAFAKLAARRDGGSDDWLFVISKEDYAFLSGFDGENFHGALEARIRELLSRARNRLRFVGPPALGRFLHARWRGEPRVEYLAYCDFQSFESALRQAKVVAYWNVVSSTLLYCLYYRVPPVFFGAGHQAKVCSGFYEHAVGLLYRDRAPRLLDLKAQLPADPDALTEQLGIAPWLDAIGADYTRLPAPDQVIEEIIRYHGH